MFIFPFFYSSSLMYLLFYVCKGTGGNYGEDWTRAVSIMHHGGLGMMQNADVDKKKKSIMGHGDVNRVHYGT